MSDMPRMLLGNPNDWDFNPEYVFYLQKANKALQAQIDALMFEYCPDDMTAKQIHDYGIAQHKVEYLDIPVFLRKDCDIPPIEVK